MAYKTSTLYKEAIDKEAKTTFIDGEIKSTNGVKIHVTNEMIAPGSLYVTNQCVNSDSFEYGAVFTAELGITLKTEIDRYTLYDAEVNLGFNILLSNGLYERIPLGIFEVNEPTRVGRNITIKAYDRMVRLEEEIFESVTGTPYELLAYLAARCDVSLSQSKNEIDMLTNSSVLLTVSPEKVSTYRELLSCICKVTCTFAAFDREGMLRLYEYAISPSKTIEAKQRTASKFSDFETYFSGVKGTFIYDGTEKSYMQTDGGTGIIYDMGSVPIVQGLDVTNQGVVANISLKTSPIKYVPCTISFTGDPSIELGDMIKSIERNGNEVMSLVTFYKWIYRGSHQIKSAGLNPKLLKVKSKSLKEIANLKNDMATKDVSVYTYTNASEVVIQGGDSDAVTSMNSLATVSFASRKASVCMVMVTIPISMAAESNVEIYQLFDGLEMMGGLIAQRCHVGLSTITFVNYFNTKANAIHKYSIVGITKGVDDGEPGELTVNPYSLKVIVFGQGLESTVQWDGSAIVNDTVPIISILSRVTIPSIDDSVNINKNAYNPYQVVDRVKKISIRNHVSVVGLVDSVESTFET